MIWLIIRQGEALYSSGEWENWLMDELQYMLGYYVNGVQFPEASGFEVLELLDIRRQLALREGELDVTQRERLAEADSVFLHHAPKFYRSMVGLDNL
jgi:hypothetical protein